MAAAEGVLTRAGIGITMEGSHILRTDLGQELLLRSADIDLDDYVDARIRVTGNVHATVEQGGTIMEVEGIERLAQELPPAILEEESSSSPVAMPVSSAAASSVAVPVPSSSSSYRSPAPAPVSSAAAMPVSSAPASIASSASVTAMAKATVDSANFTQTYCSSHIGFCIPYHRNWYFQSFGANVSPYLWHVEVGDQPVEEAGQGVIMVNLMAGPLTGSEGIAVEQGDYVVASRQWTGNRHFAVSAPTELRAAVEFMANGLTVYETPVQ